VQAWRSQGCLNEADQVAPCLFRAAVNDDDLLLGSLSCEIEFQRDASDFYRRALMRKRFAVS
jgi:hypothetical protein